MVIDTSVILHILFEEAGWEKSLALLLNQTKRYVSVASVIEAQAVIASRVQGDSKTLLDDLLTELQVEKIPLSVRHSELARAAYLLYGKGQGNKAQLNYGDVMAYALAKDYDDILAFIGNDFKHTDLKLMCLPPDA